MTRKRVKKNVFKRSTVKLKRKDVQTSDVNDQPLTVPAIQKIINSNTSIEPTSEGDVSVEDGVNCEDGICGEDDVNGEEETLVGDVAQLEVY